MQPLNLIHPSAQAARDAFHADVVSEVSKTVASNPVVVVGMSLNPHVGRARRMLDDAKVPHVYLGYGGYFSQWKQRLAIKIWSGWPTYPQVFVRGALVGGRADLKKLIDSGEIQRLLAAP